MANTYYDSQLTAAEIKAVLEAINGILTPANNGKVLAISNGKLEARSVQWGGGSTLEPLSVTANGDYYPEAGVDGFDEVHVSVPNSYTESDEGKVVSNGALVAQTARSSQITQNGTYDTTLNNEVTVDVSGGGGSNIKYAGGAYFGDFAGSATSSLMFNIHGAIGAYAVLVIMHRDTITLPSGWMLVDNRINPKTSATGNINQEISIYKKQMTAESETGVISQSSNVRMCATSFIFGSDVNISYLQTLEMDDYSTYRYTVPPQNNPVLFCMSNPYAGNTVVSLSPINMAIGVNGAFSSLSDVTIRQLASIVNSPINSVFSFGTTAGENDRAVNRAYLYSLS